MSKSYYKDGGEKEDIKRNDDDKVFRFNSEWRWCLRNDFFFIAVSQPRIESNQNGNLPNTKESIYIDR